MGALAARCRDFATKISVLRLERLTDRQRQMAELRIAGLSLGAIAKRLGISAGRVQQIEARLLSRARLEIHRRGHPPEGRRTA